MYSPRPTDKEGARTRVGTVTGWSGKRLSGSPVDRICRVAGMREGFLASLSQIFRTESYGADNGGDLDNEVVEGVFCPHANP